MKIKNYKIGFVGIMRSNLNETSILKEWGNNKKRQEKTLVKLLFFNVLGVLVSGMGERIHFSHMFLKSKLHFLKKYKTNIF